MEADRAQRGEIAGGYQKRELNDKEEGNTYEKKETYRKPDGGCNA